MGPGFARYQPPVSLHPRWRGRGDDWIARWLHDGPSELLFYDFNSIPPGCICVKQNVHIVLKVVYTAVI